MEDATNKFTGKVNHVPINWLVDQALLRIAKGDLTMEMCSDIDGNIYIKEISSLPLLRTYSLLNTTGEGWKNEWP